MDIIDGTGTENLNYVIEKDSGVFRSSREYTGFGKATYRFEEGKEEQFVGHYSNGVREGIGIYRYWNGDVYKGSYHFNKKNGIGSAEYRASPRDDGEGTDNNPIDASACTRYFGYFREGKRDKCGAILYANGDIYAGEWSNGLKCGHGRYKFASDKSELVGFWSQGRIKHGKWVLPSGVYYVGSFERNKPSGKGAWLFPNGNQVTGKFIQTVVAKSRPEQVETEEDNGDDTLPAEELYKVSELNFICEACQTLRE